MNAKTSVASMGHGLFAIAAACLAILSLVYSDLAPMWHAIPAGISGRELWVCGCAAALLVASAGLCFARAALPSASTIGAYYAVWAVASLPSVLAQPLTGVSWYGVCEATTSLAGAWILYAMLRWQLRSADMPVAAKRAVRGAQGLFGLTCIYYGWSHFAYADYTAGMVPIWLPARLGFARLTGLGHIAAGTGIAFGIFPRLAATLEALMMSLFGLLVWIPSLFAQPRPNWAGTPQNQWSELVVNMLLAACAWIVADSLSDRPWGIRQHAKYAE
jgi:uncharacterized membrane protein YphA (DoxX/SURF4 family)